MEQLLVALIASATAITVAAKGSSHPPTPPIEDVVIQGVPYPQITRVRHYTSNENTITDEGAIVVYPREFVVPRGNPPCTNTSRFGWVQLEQATIPGHKLIRFEYRIIGSAGHRNLLLYFAPIAKPTIK